MAVAENGACAFRNSGAASSVQAQPGKRGCGWRLAVAGAGGRGVSEGEERCDGVGRERRNGQSVTPWSVAEDRNGTAKMVPRKKAAHAREGGAGRGEKGERY